MKQFQSLKTKIHTIQSSVKIRRLIAASFLAIPLSAFLFVALAPLINYDLEGYDPNLQTILLNLLLIALFFFNQLSIILSTVLFLSLFITHAKMSVWKYLLLLACYAYPALILVCFFGFDLQNLAMYFSIGFKALFWQLEDFMEILQGLFRY